ncbi:hypothetical protein MTR67_000266 [Solanum verrucosum]|uniref:Uncharacterized protein n=1 Tax=Solanum verrucosum TaxID=315347 RepID=A0AAF0PQC1_SOLVR|nr:hypothetical protein MTR67_000266 [Solanum verrucosum]
MSAIEILDLSNNRLSGTVINTTFSIGNQLIIIKLDGNKLEGKVPPSLINCEYLEFLDLSNNELNDTFPKWLGGLPHLQILKLRSNKFYGPIRTKNLFAQIRVIDLSSNGFSGELPVSLFQNFQAMKIIGENSGTREYVADIYSYYYTNSLIVTTKGLDHELPRVLTTQIIIDLSSNRFEGCIPSIIGDLVGLRTLNLSHNVLEGHIPESLQHLSVLESLDLSSNKISGEIPQQLASLTFLAVLNLSHNHLVGCIPRGNQFNTFENNSYQGNDGLRGLPPSRDCGRDDRVPQETIPVELDQEEEEEDSPMISWQGVLMGYCCGVVIGLSVIYIMLSTQYPTWFSRMVVELEHRITTRMKKHKKRGKQFDTFENSSYQGNDGLRGLPPSRDCGRDDRVPQATIPVEQDQEEEEEEDEGSPMINWQAVLMGYGCGLVIGLSIIYIMLSTQYPTWFSRMVVKSEHRMITRMKRHKKRY